jgi:anaerobic magnesium-protoporphyrin IX monomethyl ester cyclase
MQNTRTEAPAAGAVGAGSGRPGKYPHTPARGEFAAVYVTRGYAEPSLTHAHAQARHPLDGRLGGGFEEETDHDRWCGLRQLLAYDPDQIQVLYVTPHRWTPYFRLAAHRRVIQPDRKQWDYKHQVLATRHMRPWRVLVWFKFTDMVLQGRPKALRRTWFQRDRTLRWAMRWYSQMGRRVWPYEIKNFLFGRRLKNGPSVARFWGAPHDAEERSTAASRSERRVKAAT